jgi:hypothetical protein
VLIHIANVKIDLADTLLLLREYVHLDCLRLVATEVKERVGGHHEILSA